MKYLFLLTISLSTLISSAQTASTPQEISREFWKALSGPAGPRDWKKVQSYCLPTVQINAVRYKNGSLITKTGDLNSYRANTDGFFKSNAFYQDVTEEQVSSYDQIAQVIQRYTTTVEFSNGSVSIVDGIATIQLVKKKDDWKISSISWNDQTPGTESVPHISATTYAGNDRPEAGGAPDRYEMGVEGYIYTDSEVDSLANFPGGDAAIVAWLGQNLMVPEDSVEAAMSGAFEVSFVVDKNGFVSNVSSVDCPGPGWHYSASYALTSMPKWNAALYGGNAVNSRIRLKIRFKGK